MVIISYFVHFVGFIHFPPKFKSRQKLIRPCLYKGMIMFSVDIVIFEAGKDAVHVQQCMLTLRRPFFAELNIYQ